MNSQISPEFAAAVQNALRAAAQSPDETIRYMTQTVPVYLQQLPDREQTVAGGCTTCTYLGLWADKWRGYPQADHGTIWLFEAGIRSRGGDLTQQTLATLLHEYDHAAQRDHVLAGLRQAKAAMTWPPVRARGCGGCGH